MKKFLMLLFLSLFVIGLNCKAWALPDRVSANEYTTTTQVKSSSGEVFSVHVSYIGVTAGDKIQIFDSATSSGTVRYTCVASTTSGSCGDPLTVANYFGTGIYYKETKSGGSFITDIQYF